MKNYLRMKLCALALLLFVSAIPAQSQTLQDSDIISNSPMYFRYVLGFDPGNRWYFDFFSNSVYALPGDQRMRTVRAYFNITPLQTGYIYEFEIPPAGYRPPTDFGFFAQKCVAVVTLDDPCTPIYWREVDSTPGVYRFAPAPSVEEPNPPSFAAAPGDKFALEWADNGTHNWGRFNYYKNRTLVFSTTETPPVIPFPSASGFTFRATFDPSDTVQLLTGTREIQFAN